MTLKNCAKMEDHEPSPDKVSWGREGEKGDYKRSPHGSLLLSKGPTIFYVCASFVLPYFPLVNNQQKFSWSCVLFFLWIPHLYSMNFISPPSLLLVLDRSCPIANGSLPLNWKCRWYLDTRKNPLGFCSTLLVESQKAEEAKKASRALWD